MIGMLKKNQFASNVYGRAKTMAKHAGMKSVAISEAAKFAYCAASSVHDKFRKYEWAQSLE